MTVPWNVLLEEIRGAIEHVKTWTPKPIESQLAKDRGARSFEGKADGWIILVLDYDLATAGAPPGSRGCDGSAISEVGVGRSPHALRLPPAFAERAMARAVAERT